MAAQSLISNRCHDKREQGRGDELKFTVQKKLYKGGKRIFSYESTIYNDGHFNKNL